MLTDSGEGKKRGRRAIATNNEVGLFPFPSIPSSPVIEADESGAPFHQKRKEQNRAAQRAFRERKERYVRELEDKVQSQADENRSLRELLGR